MPTSFVLVLANLCALNSSVIPASSSCCPRGTTHGSDAMTMCSVQTHTRQHTRRLISQCTHPATQHPNPPNFDSLCTCAHAESGTSAPLFYFHDVRCVYFDGCKVAPRNPRCALLEARTGSTIRTANRFAFRSPSDHATSLNDHGLSC